MANSKSRKNVQALQQRLEEIKNAHASGSSISDVWGKMHSLAEEQFEPAIDFFFSLLDDSGWRWREEAASFLGFHYDLSLRANVIDKMRRLALEDPEPAVRMTVSSVLGIRTSWPDHTLLDVLAHDPESNVRQAAFLALLKQGGISQKSSSAIRKQLEAGEYAPTEEQLRRIMKEEGSSYRFADL